MSHIVTIKTEVRDAAAVRDACKRLGLAEPVQGTTRLFSGEVSGLVVLLPGWQYPVVADLATGQLRFDNFGGRWGDQQQLLSVVAEMFAMTDASPRSTDVRGTRSLRSRNPPAEWKPRSCG